MIEIRVIPDPTVPKRFGSIRASFETRFRKAMAKSEARAKRLQSGEVLKVQTGRLRAATTHQVNRVSDDLIEGRLGSNTRYLPPHELGAVIPARTVRPVRARALRFTVGGQVVFSQYANIPSFPLPPRPTLTPSLEQEMRDLLKGLESDLGRLK